MDENKQREISKKGGEASHGGGRGSSTSTSKSEAGHKGGESSHGGR